MMTTQQASESLNAINAKIAAACAMADRRADEVTLVAVSKTHGASTVKHFLESGQRVFGENRVQEAMLKWPELRAQCPDVQLHLIGPLQSNKAREAISTFDCIETLDRDSLATALAKEIQRVGRQPVLYIQVNTGLEPQKSGISPQNTHEFIKKCQKTYNLIISGLMCIPPADQIAAPHFALLDKLANEAGLEARSMGMSGDFEQAILCGATHLRVGSALFGTRGLIL